MRDLILQLLPEISVSSVPGVLQAGNARKPYDFERKQAGTPLQTAGVPCVSDTGHGTLGTAAAKQSVP